MKYLALLRGVNVGGKSAVKMADLKSHLEAAEFYDVKTYINSGNVIFNSAEKNTANLATDISRIIKTEFGLNVSVVVIDHVSYKRMIENIPKEWGKNPEWKCNLLFLIPPYDLNEIIADIGELKPNIEAMTIGEGVIYQSMSIKLFGRTTAGKLAGKAAYQRITIRNPNTGRKLLELMEA
jgi:uncharacterized protein (DUF1697 family)